ncbi:hypothetical protein L228DRAFT_49645 [Xylona heveae TC161]|uniref:Uncharacterized protein n=1 Tax=Xylona heveae (strain CBS 132557 / TC161) TaxID=1328760 RepID=A0A164ZM31_XYLHT|nr:hypothetical protein L228DRAFT_49645 [Xylona heveae TC161]KZF19264.1 hypothetical protein L228DRAFT_49645 [Xylona heveae TC161]
MSNFNFFAHGWDPKLAGNTRPRRRRGRRPAPVTASNMNAGRAPIGTPMRLPINSNYSHNTTHQASSPEQSRKPENEDPLPAGRIPSYQVQTEAFLSAIQASIHQPTADPHTSPSASNTSFAARARAAELSAARARQARMASKNPEVSPLGSIPLNSLTKFKPSSRSRTRAWKPLNLDGLEGVQRPSTSNSTTSTLAPSPERSSSKLSSMVQSSGTETITDTVPFMRKPTSVQEAVARGNLALGYQGSVPSNTSHNAGMLTQYSSSQNNPTSQFVPDNVASNYQGSPSIFKASRGVSAAGGFGGAAMPNSFQSPSQVQAYSFSSGGFPVATRYGYTRNQQHGFQPALPFFNQMADDPFIGQSPYAASLEMGVASNSFQNTSTVQGGGSWDTTMGIGLDISTVQPPPGFGNHGPKTEDSTIEPYTPTMALAERARHAETESSSEKREKLLRTLKIIAESGRARGSASARTVLYDPLKEPSADDIGIEALSLAEPVQTTATPQNDIASARGSCGPIGSSEPLPWKDRLADIHTENPFGINQTIHNQVVFGEHVNESNPFAVYLKQPVLREEELNAGNLERLQRVDDWFHQDNRFPSEVRSGLNLAGESDELLRGQYKQQSQGLNHENSSREGQAFTTKKGSAFGAVGSGRPSSKSAASSVTLGEEQPQRIEQRALSTGKTGMEKLFNAALGTLQGYVSQPPEVQAGKFGSFARVPEWCIDRSPNGASSFFGEDWGAPPQRIGRDPRYRLFGHDARYNLYEDAERRLGSDGYGRRYR